MNKEALLRIGLDLRSALLSRRLFWAFGLLLLLYDACGVILLYSWGGLDYWEHVAAMAAFARNPIHPATAYAASSAPTHLFTPYHLVWGLAARAFSIHPFYLLPLVGTLNLLLFLISVRSFSRILTGTRDYALVLALAILFLWYRPWLWSGIPAFGLLPLTSIYPFWPAFSLGLLVLGSIDRLGRTTGASMVHGGIFAGGTLIFLVHPLTAVFLAVSLIALLLSRPDLSGRTRFIALASLASSLAFGMLWPYYPVLATTLAASRFGSIGFSGDYREFYEAWYLRVAPCAVVLPLLIYFAVKRKIDFPALSALFFAVIYFPNQFFLRSAVLARTIIYLALHLQFALTAVISRVPGLLVGLVVLVLAMAPLQVRDSLHWFGLTRDLREKTPLGTHSNRRLFTRYSALTQFIQPEDVVLADPEISTMLSAIVPCKVIATSHPTPFLVDFPQRWEFANAFFTHGTSPEMRENVLNLYHVRWMVIQSDQRFVLTGIEARVRVSLEWEGHLLLSSTGSSPRVGINRQ